MQKFITIGRNNISKSLFKPAVQDYFKECSKPEGGLWATTFSVNNDSHIISSWWLMYLSLRESLFYAKFREKASIITLKENAKVLTVNNEQMKELKEKYPTNHGLINYIKLAEDYDALYFKYERVYGGSEFDDWCCPSLVIFNLDSIQSYKPVKITYTYDIEEDFTFYLDDHYEEKIVEDYDPEIEKLYVNYKATFQENNFDDYHDLDNKITKHANEYFNNMINDSNQNEISRLKSIFICRLIKEKCLETNILEKENGLNL